MLKDTRNNIESNSNISKEKDNNGNDYTNLSPETLERYKKNKEFRDKTKVH
jgi:hypothetical protein